MTPPQPTQDPCREALTRIVAAMKFDADPAYAHLILDAERALAQEPAGRDTFRAAKWLDPECAEAGCRQSLKFKGSTPAPQEPAPIHPLARIEAEASYASAFCVDAQVVPLSVVREVLSSTPAPQETTSAEQAAQVPGPLSEERIRGLRQTLDAASSLLSTPTLTHIVRAVERAHGIGVQLTKEGGLTNV